MKEQVELLFDFNLAFNLIDFCEIASAFRFDHIMSIDRTVLHAGKRNEIAQRELINNLRDFLFFVSVV